MFKKFILVCIGVIVALSATAQVTVQRGNSTKQNENLTFESKSSAFVMKYGIKAGVNMTSMSNDMSFDPGFGMGVGYNFGGFLNMRWGQRTENSLPGTGVWGFQPELLYSGQVVKSDAGDITMNYISVPLLLKIYPTTSFSIEVGPEFSYLMATSPSTMAADGAEISVGDCKGLNMGIAAGLAYDFEMGLTFNARYTYGFNDIAKNLKWKGSNIQVSIGWMF
ncbi:MAG: PorT family protein [Bacteroidaceae bacterium]|nr:PorT family protein [Bacteroidaceae bacterium]